MGCLGFVLYVIVCCVWLFVIGWFVVSLFGCIWLMRCLFCVYCLLVCIVCWLPWWVVLFGFILLFCFALRLGVVWFGWIVLFLIVLMYCYCFGFVWLTYGLFALIEIVVAYCWLLVVIVLVWRLLWLLLLSVFWLIVIVVLDYYLFVLWIAWLLHFDTLLVVFDWLPFDLFDWFVVIWNYLNLMMIRFVFSFVLCWNCVSCFGCLDVLLLCLDYCCLMFVRVGLLVMFVNVCILIAVWIGVCFNFGDFVCLLRCLTWLELVIWRRLFVAWFAVVSVKCFLCSLFCWFGFVLVCVLLFVQS